MAQEILKELLTGSGPIVVLLFGFLLVYFIYDIIKKVSRTEGIESMMIERIEKVALNCHDTRNILQAEIIRRENNTKCLEKLQDEIKELNNRLLSIDTVNKYKRHERAAHQKNGGH